VELRIGTYCEEGTLRPAINHAPARLGAAEILKMMGLQQLPDFLARLEAHAIRYSLVHDRAGAITVRIAVPGERWEVGFLDDGSVDVEVFAGVDGVVSGPEAAALLERLFSDGGSDA
jgi:hypothetical protein